MMKDQQPSGDRLFDLAVSHAMLAQYVEDFRREYDAHLQAEDARRKEKAASSHSARERIGSYIQIAVSALAGAIASHFIR